MKKIIAPLITIAILISCNENRNSGIPKELVGKWERSTQSARTEAFEIINEEGNYFLDTYTYFKKPTKYVKANGDTILMAMGSSTTHKKVEFFYDEEMGGYKWLNDGLFIDIKIIDNDHLELKFPIKTQLYNRIK